MVERTVEVMCTALLQYKERDCGTNFMTSGIVYLYVFMVLVSSIVCLKKLNKQMRTLFCSSKINLFFLWNNAVTYHQYHRSSYDGPSICREREREGGTLSLIPSGCFKGCVMFGIKMLFWNIGSINHQKCCEQPQIAANIGTLTFVKTK